MLCSTGKVVHFSRAKAKESIADMRAHGHKVKLLQAYLCTECGYFHVGTAKKRSRDYHRKKHAAKLRKQGSTGSD